VKWSRAHLAVSVRVLQFKQVNSYVYEFTGHSAASRTASSAPNAAAGSGANQLSQASSAAAAAAAAGSIDGQKVDFVLVHGLQLGNYRSAYAKTWQKREHGKVICSLPDCIVRDYPNARVLSVSYNSTAFGDVMTSSWPDAAVQVSKHLAGEHCGLNPPLGAAPLILVGHSLGGLMIKQLCLELEQKYTQVFSIIEGVLFYATPHMGSWFGNKLECLLACLPCVRKGGVLRYLRVLSEDTANLNNKFDDIRHTLDEGLRKARFATQAMTETVSGTVSMSLNADCPFAQLQQV
jgi:triacylglycerol esterase/lipase EstA (alpha/beta hydrolase family)